MYLTKYIVQSSFMLSILVDCLKYLLYFNVSWGVNCINYFNFDACKQACGSYDCKRSRQPKNTCYNAFINELLSTLLLCFVYLYLFIKNV